MSGLGLSWAMTLRQRVSARRDLVAPYAFLTALSVLRGSLPPQISGGMIEHPKSGLGGLGEMPIRVAPSNNFSRSFSKVLRCDHEIPNQDFQRRPA